MTAHQRLRADTAADHERVDALFSQFDLADPAGYGRFLAAQAQAFLPVEAALDDGGAERLVPDWSARRRADLLIADLEALARPIPLEWPTYRLDTEADLLGALYILEGSRLGGAMLKRQVPAAAPRRFLDAPQPPGAWRNLLILLDNRLRNEDEAAGAIGAARGVFGLFEAAASAQLRTSYK